MMQRVKAAQKERDGLQQDKEAAETYIAKELECLGAQSLLAQALHHQAQASRFEVCIICLAATHSITDRQHVFCTTFVQQNVNMIEANLVKLEARLQHEQQKFKEYDELLKEHEQK